MQPAVEALSAHFDTVTFSLKASTTLDGYVDQVSDLLAARRIGPSRHLRRVVRRRRGAAIRGAASGRGLLRWSSRPRPRQDGTSSAATSFYARLPRLFGPLFLVEIAMAHARRARGRAAGSACATPLQAPCDSNRAGSADLVPRDGRPCSPHAIDRSPARLRQHHGADAGRHRRRPARPRRSRRRFVGIRASNCRRTRRGARSDRPSWFGDAAGRVRRADRATSCATCRGGGARACDGRVPEPPDAAS